MRDVQKCNLFVKWVNKKLFRAARLPTKPHDLIDKNIRISSFLDCTDSIGNDCRFTIVSIEDFNINQRRISGLETHRGNTLTKKAQKTKTLVDIKGAVSFLNHLFTFFI